MTFFVLINSTSPEVSDQAVYLYTINAIQDSQ